MKVANQAKSWPQGSKAQEKPAAQADCGDGACGCGCGFPITRESR